MNDITYVYTGGRQNKSKSTSQNLQAGRHRGRPARRRDRPRGAGAAGPPP